jgi:tRNA nucleotidyltransferase/poly(A) polymerase
VNKIYQVGGSIRDKMMGFKPKDIDFAVEAESFDAMREMIIARGGKIFLETPEFFTIRANVPQLGSADYVLCRKDGAYNDGRRPESVTVGNILDDLARRDFTMNAIAIDTETGKGIDPYLGLTDIINRQIRCVGNPNERLREDSLRVFRALRFAIVKNFSIHYDTKEAIREISLHHKNFDGVSTERIREELLKMFSRDSFDSWMILEEFDLLPLIKERGIWFKPTTEKV